MIFVAVAGLASNAIVSIVIPTAIFGCCNTKLLNEATVFAIFSPQFYSVKVLYKFYEIFRL